MTAPSSSQEQLPTVWQEVRQRRVGKVVASYLALAFAGIEIGIKLFSTAAPPEWLWRGCLGALVLGFPVAVVLAWRYDITPDGVVRTPDDLGDAPDDPTSSLWIWLTTAGLITGSLLELFRG